MWARGLREWSRRRDSNPEPAVYKTAALPIELRRQRTANQGLSQRREMIGRPGRTGQARGVRGLAARRGRGAIAGSGSRSSAVVSAGSATGATFAARGLRGLFAGAGA